MRNEKTAPFNPDESCRANIARLDRMQNSISERMYAQLCEIVTFSFGTDKDIMSHETAVRFNEVMSKYRLTEAFGRGEFAHQQRHAARQRMLVCCRLLRQLLCKNNQYCLYDFVPEAAERAQLTDSIAYFKNLLSDSAYKLFCKKLPDAYVAYCPDFISVCEAVYYEKAKYCILPLENSSDGRLGGFYNLLEKYELSISLCCYVTSADGAVKTRYALCEKNLSRETVQAKVKYAEVLVNSQVGGICDIPVSAEFFGVKTVRADCVPDAYSADSCRLYFTFEGREDELCDLFLYFHLAQLRYTTVGIYSVIK